MKIATHNVKFLFGEGTHSHSGKEWIYTPEYVQARVDHFAKVFSEINADILLLQEVASEDVIKRIIAQSEIDYAYFFATPKDNVGNAVLYKQKDAVGTTVPAKTNLPVFIEGDEDVLGSRIWSRRDFVQLTTIYNDKPLYLLGIHVKANFLVPEKTEEGIVRPMTTQIDIADSLIRSEIFRFSQAKKAREIIDSFFAQDPEAQIIVGGDFNATEYHSIFRIIRGDPKLPSDSLISATKDIPEEKRYSGKSQGKSVLIDHLLISKALESHLGNVRIINDDLIAPENIPGPLTFAGSDHAPVVIELK